MLFVNSLKSTELGGFGEFTLYNNMVISKN